MSQTDQLYNLLKSGRPVRTDEIVTQIYSGGALARVGGRINDVAKKYKVEFIDEFGNPLGVKKGELKGWHDKDNPKLYWYRIRPAKMLYIQALPATNSPTFQSRVLPPAMKPVKPQTSPLFK